MKTKQPSRPVIALIVVCGVVVSVVGPVVGYRMIFTSSFALSCMQRGAPAQVCECAADKTLERASIGDVFDGERMKQHGIAAFDDCR